MTPQRPRHPAFVRRFILLNLAVLLPVLALRAEEDPNLRWPPLAYRQWDDATKVATKTTFDAYLAMSAEVLDVQRAHVNEGAEALYEALKPVLARHPNLPASLPKELDAPYVNHVSAQYLLMSRSIIEIPRQQELVESQLASSLKLAANEPDLWIFRSLLQQYRGNWDESRAAMAMAEAVARHREGGMSKTLREKIDRRNAMLGLPAEVREVPQTEEIDYSVSLMKQNTLMGKEYTDDQHKMAAALYANLGARLAVAWPRDDAATVVPQVFRAHASELEFIKYPDSVYDTLKPKVADALAKRDDDPEAALAVVTEMATLAPLPNVLVIRATILGQLERWDDALADLDGALLIEPKYEVALEARERFAKRAKAAAAAELERLRVEADALVAEAKAAFRQGDEKTGMARVEAALALVAYEPAAVILKSTWLGAQNRAADAKALLDAALAAHPEAPEVAAVVVLGKVGARDFDGALVLANKMEKAFPKNASIQAAMALAVFGSWMSEGKGDMAGWIANSLERVDNALALDPNNAVALTVRAQFRMMSGNRAGAVEDMARLVEVSDYVPSVTLQQVAAMMKQLGKTAEADAVLARMPK